MLRFSLLLLLVGVSCCQSRLSELRQKLEDALCNDIENLINFESIFYPSKYGVQHSIVKATVALSVQKILNESNNTADAPFVYCNKSSQYEWWDDDLTFQFATSSNLNDKLKGLVSSPSVQSWMYLHDYAMYSVFYSLTFGVGHAALYSNLSYHLNVFELEEMPEDNVEVISAIISLLSWVCKFLAIATMNSNNCEVTVVPFIDESNIWSQNSIVASYKIPRSK